MTTFQLHIDWGDTLKPAQARFDDADRALARTRGLKSKTQIELDRLASAGVRNRSSAMEARVREEDFLRRASDADRKGQEMKRRGMPRSRWNRWEAETRHWRAEGEQSAKEIEDSENDARRREDQAQQISRQIRDLTLRAGNYLTELKYWEERLSFLRTLTRRLRASRDPGGTGAELHVTPNAGRLLYQMMGSLNTKAGEAFRITPTLTGGVKISLDFQKRTDDATRHRGRVVLLMESPLPRDLAGLTLDGR